MAQSQQIHYPECLVFNNKKARHAKERESDTSSGKEEMTEISSICFSR
jgi:hypothetical protein